MSDDSDQCVADVLREWEMEDLETEARALRGRVSELEEGLSTLLQLLPYGDQFAAASLVERLLGGTA